MGGRLGAATSVDMSSERISSASQTSIDAAMTTKQFLNLTEVSSLGKRLSDRVTRFEARGVMS